MVAVNVRVTTRSIDLIMNLLSGATLATTASDMLRGNLRELWAYTTTTHSGGGLIHPIESTTVHGDIRVSASAVGVVHLGAACSR